MPNLIQLIYWNISKYLNGISDIGKSVNGRRGLAPLDNHLEVLNLSVEN
jgi:hypothetical protein